MIVVDLGCATYPNHPGDESMLTLLERFRPSVYYGFDPHPSVVERDRWVGGSRTIIQRKAAWTRAGVLGFVTTPAVGNELGSYTADAPVGETVECFDLARFLGGCVPYASGELVLKLDVEGAEYPLLEHLVGHDIDPALSLIMVEWHEIEGGPARVLEILKQLRCPVEEW